MSYLKGEKNQMNKNNNLFNSLSKLDIRFDFLESALSSLGKDIYLKQLELLDLRSDFISIQNQLEDIKKLCNSINERNDNINEK